jgi:hypothetical protein
MEKEDTISVQWAQEDVETSYNLRNNNNNKYIYIYIYHILYIYSIRLVANEIYSLELGIVYEERLYIVLP